MAEIIGLACQRAVPLGRAEEARRTAEQLIAARPNFTIDAWLKTQFRRDMARVEADTAAPARRRLPLG